MLFLFLLQLAQRPQPTVGDTLWATRTVRLAAGDSVRPAPWELEGAVQLLGRPTIQVRGNLAEIRYPLVAWEAGSHVLDVPGPIVTRADGVEDTLPAIATAFAVASVLPSNVPESTLAVQPPAQPVLRSFRSPLPALLLGGVAVLALLPLHWWWRRRGEAGSHPAPAQAPALEEDTVRRWAEAGERRTVAAAASARLRAAIARALPEAHVALDTPALLAVIDRERPNWPREELHATLRALDELRFAPSRATVALELYQRSLKLAESLPGERR